MVQIPGEQLNPECSSLTNVSCAASPLHEGCPKLPSLSSETFLQAFKASRLACKIIQHVHQAHPEIICFAPISIWYSDSRKTR